MEYTHLSNVFFAIFTSRWCLRSFTADSSTTRWMQSCPCA